MRAAKAAWTMVIMSFGLVFICSRPNKFLGDISRDSHSENELLTMQCVLFQVCGAASSSERLGPQLMHWAGVSRVPRVCLGLRPRAQGF